MTLIQTVEELSKLPSYRVEITFGHRDAKGLPVSLAAITEAKAYLREVLNAACGGGRMPPPRIIPHVGFYRHANGSSVDEDSTTVAAYGSGEDIPYWRFRHASGYVASLLHQEAVLLVVERLQGGVFFVSADAFNESDRLSVAAAG